MLKSRIILHFLYLFLIYTCTHRCYSVTVLDSKKPLNYPQYNFNGKKCKQLFNSTKSSLKTIYNKTVEDIKAHPVSATLTGATLCLSTAVWTNCLDTSQFYLRSSPKKLKDFVKSLLNMFLVPNFNGLSLFNILSFYYSLRDLESTKGSSNTLKLTSLDAFVSLLVSYLVNNKLDFGKFSRSILILSCFFKPQDEVLVYGLFTAKKMHLPIYLLALDLFLTLEPSNLLDGLLGTCFGVLTGLFYQLLTSYNLVDF